jgi:pimeloyl-ACP methyl ester carboxylesterase
VKHAEVWADALPLATVQRVPGGHFPSYEQPGTTQGLVADFLADTGDSTDVGEPS